VWSIRIDNQAIAQGALGVVGRNNRFAFEASLINRLVEATLTSLQPSLILCDHAIRMRTTQSDCRSFDEHPI